MLDFFRSSKFITIKLFLLLFLLFISGCVTTQPRNQQITKIEYKAEWANYKKPDFGDILGHVYRSELKKGTSELELARIYLLSFKDTHNEYESYKKVFGSTEQLQTQYVRKVKELAARAENEKNILYIYGCTFKFTKL
ncbi:MAG: hypothetical protein ACOYU2_04335 [Nitrospirota bacterium]